MSRYLKIALMSLILTVGLGWWAVETLVGPPPVLPEGLADLDPDVGAAVNQAGASIRLWRGSQTARLKLAMTYEANNMPGYAALTYEQAIESGDGDADTWYRLGMSRAQAGDVQAGIDALERAVAWDSSSPWHSWRLALWLLDAGELDRAEELLQSARAIDDSEPAVDFAQVRVLLLRKNPQAAIALIQRRGLLSPQIGRYRGHQPRDYARLLYAEALRMSGLEEEAASQFAMVGDAAATFNDPSTASMRRFTTGVRVVLNRAGQLVVAGDYARAVELLEPKASLPGADSVQVRNLLAICYIEMGRGDEGIALLRDALDENPDAYQTQANLAQAYHRLTRDPVTLRNLALEHANRAVELRPGYGSAYAQRAIIYERLKDYAQSSADYRKAFELDSRDVAYLVDAGWSDLRAGQPAAAIEAFDRALKQNPDAADAHAGRAFALAERGENLAARRALARAESAKSATPWRRAAARRRVGDSSGAID